jgi:hypothetical protein
MKNGFKTLVKTPLLFMKQPSFLLVWGVYAGIYTVANTIDIAMDQTSITSFLPKFLLTSVVSIYLNITKDNKFGQMFRVGTGKPRPMAVSSMACFGARNGMTILAAFSMPGMISKQLQSQFQVAPSRADAAVQLVIPVSMQVFNTPLHLLGYDIYNRPAASGPERLQFIRREYTKTLLARIGHIFPAYGIGGVMNSYIRKTGMEYVHRWREEAVDCLPRGEAVEAAARRAGAGGAGGARPSTGTGTGMPPSIPTDTTGTGGAAVPGGVSGSAGSAHPPQVPVATSSMSMFDPRTKT